MDQQTRRAAVKKGLEQIPTTTPRGGGLIGLRDWLRDEGRPVLLDGRIADAVSGHT